MHVFLEEVGTLVATVSVEYSEVAASGPSSLEVRFCYVHDDRDAILVVVLHKPVKGIDGVTLDSPVATLDELHCINAGNGRSLLLFLMSHLFLTIISI